MQEGSTMVTPGYEQTETGGGVAMTTGANDQGTGFGQPDQAQFEADKRSVYKHPLFPLLALLFERCEQATQSAECPNSESFNMDIQAFVQHQERDRKPFFVNDPEVDGLVSKMYFLRIFRNNYLLRLSYSKHKVVSSAGGVPPPHHHHHQGGGGGGQPVLMSTTQPQAVSSSQIAYQMVQTAQGLVAAPVHIPAQAPSPGIVHGSTPLSQIGANPCPPPSDTSLIHGQLSPAPTTPGSMDDDDDYLSNKKKQKRGVLPKHATSVMRSWLFQHLVHPYPTEDEKRQIAAQTNLTLLQVNNWFINARRRILQPMLDASNPSSNDQPGSGNSLHSKSASAKKVKNSGNGNNSSLISSTVLSSEESEGSSQDEDEDEDDFEEEGEERTTKLEGDASSDSEQQQ
ncbi:hypothetical protein C0J52_05257 [Blattella germanica]|nr:hypothetical protein C0J52_05257 [Blattella germanica]